MVLVVENLKRFYGLCASACLCSKVDRWRGWEYKDFLTGWGFKVSLAKKEIYTLESIDDVRQVAAPYLENYPIIKNIIFMRGFSDGSRAILTTNGKLIEGSHVLKPETQKYCLTDLDLPEYQFFCDIINTELSGLKKVYDEECRIQKEKFNITQELIFVRKHQGYVDHFSFSTEAPTNQATIFFSTI